ncbi:MAG: formate/nitrite transporter family protein, partial [Lentisphaeria bacterium]|nr:formate/nitrite transporter family protein [Lentisphaeria bacterium]
GTVFLSLENKALGALLFCVGLFMVCTLGLYLFTGKACYLPGKGWDYVLFLVIVWVGNLVGAELTAVLLKLTRVGAMLCEKAAGLCAVKVGDDYLSLFILGIFCNIMIFVGVESYLANKHEVGKYLGMILGVVVFILCGFEHCVADMFYFAMGGWPAGSLPALAVITLGNTAGGVIFPLCLRFRDKVLKQ